MYDDKIITKFVFSFLTSSVSVQSAQPSCLLPEVSGVKEAISEGEQGVSECVSEVCSILSFILSYCFFYSLSFVRPLIHSSSTIYTQLSSRTLSSLSSPASPTLLLSLSLFILLQPMWNLLLTRTHGERKTPYSRKNKDNLVVVLEQIVNA